MSDLISRCELFNRLAPVQTLGEAYGIIQGMDTVDAVPVERKSVSGYEGLYEVDNLSRVFSLRTGKQMKQMVDLISRQAAVEAMRRAKDKSELHRMLVQLPSAQKYGTWIVSHFGANAKCSECGMYCVGVYDHDRCDQYCRCCGAKMDGLKLEGGQA